MVSIFCNNTGAYTPETKYLWYINNTFVNVSHHKSIEILETNTYSILHIINSTFLTGNFKITCEAVIPMVVRANASLTVTLGDIKQGTDEPAKMFYIIIITASTGGALEIIIFVLLFYCICIKWKRSNIEDNNHEIPAIEKDSTSKKKSSSKITHSARNEHTKTNQIDASQHQGNNSENQSSAANVAEIELSIHALPNESNSTKKECSDDRVSALPNKNKYGVDKGLSSFHSDMNTLTNNTVEVKTVTITNKNGEGLNYADIDITFATQEDGVNNSIIRTERATIYTEVNL